MSQIPAPAAGSAIWNVIVIRLIDKSGSWYSYNGERIGQGRENVKAFLTDNPDIFEDAYGRVRESVGLVPKASVDEEAGEESK